MEIADNTIAPRESRVARVSCEVSTFVPEVA
jgi:hypothetical protein